MKTKLISVLFLASLAFLGQSCMEEKIPPGSTFPVNVTNRYALLLQERLQTDVLADTRYVEVLSDHTPVYEEVRLSTHSAYGLCYIIPYCSRSGSVIEGAVYFPAGATCAEDGTVTFDHPLGMPVSMDARKINEDVPLTERYTYSMPFKHLQAKGWKVDPDLLVYADLLDDKIIPLAPEDFTDYGIDTKSITTYVLEIYMYYEIYYDGPETEAIIGMHPEMLIRIVEGAIEKMGIKDLRNPCRHSGVSTMTISIPENLLPTTNIDSFIQSLMSCIRQRAWTYNFRVYNSYIYRRIPQEIGSGSGGIGGSSSGGGSNSGSGKPFPTPPFNEPIMDNSSGSQLIQSKTEKLWKSLDTIKARTIGENNYISFQTYLAEVKKAPNREHATLLIDYEEDDEDHTRVLTEVFHGSEDQVMQSYSSKYVKAEIHNHPDGSPPSAQDLLFTAEMSQNEYHYEATFVYNQGKTSYYSLYVFGGKISSETYSTLKNEIDSGSRDFKNNGDCQRFLKAHEYVYKDFTLEMKRIYSLCLISEKYDLNIAVTKYNPETEMNEVYRVEKGTDKEGNISYAPLICK